MATAHAASPVALVVENDDAVRHLASAVLEETEFDVIECKNAEAAMSVLERPGVNVALLFADVGLPGAMDGAALARTVAKRWPNVRMVVTSDRSTGGKDGVPSRAVYMQKPWRALDVLVQAEHASDESSAA